MSSEQLDYDCTLYSRDREEKQNKGEPESSKPHEMLLKREHTSRAHPAVVRTDSVRYDRVMIGICLYQSSTNCAMFLTFAPNHGTLV